MSTLSQFVGGGGVKSLQRGTILLGVTTTATVTISPVNTSKAYISFLGFTPDGAYTDTRATARIALTSSTTVEAVKPTTSGGSTVSYEVIEFY